MITLVRIYTSQVGFKYSVPGNFVSETASVPCPAATVLCQFIGCSRLLCEMHLLSCLLYVWRRGAQAAGFCARFCVATVSSFTADVSLTGVLRVKERDVIFFFFFFIIF